jgi:Zn-dependent protease
VIIAVTFHEVAHGLVAEQFGDPTAREAGRLSLNPLKHVDRFGTILLPALLWITTGGRFLFGYAKPVPVDFRRLVHPLRDMVWVALAGPATNVLLAIAAAILFYGIVLLPGGQEVSRAGLAAILGGELAAPQTPAGWFAANLANAIVINVILCVFNMLPLPPLDGGRVAVGILPRVLAIRLARVERYGLLIVMLLIFVLPWIGEHLGYNLNILTWLVGVPADLLARFVLTITGQGG